MHYTGKMKEHMLTPEMERCLAALNRHGRLERYYGGNWNAPDLEGPARFDAGFGTSTISALVRRNRVQYEYKEGRQTGRVKLAFDNEDRHRWYGIRRGDMVRGYHDQQLGEVVGYDLMDNNRVEVCWQGSQEYEGVVAEWLTVVTKVEDKEMACGA